MLSQSVINCVKTVFVCRFWADYINPSDANEESLNESLDYFIENLHYAKYIGAEMVGLELAVSVMTMK